jgi:hypothetical protein
MFANAKFIIPRVATLFLGLMVYAVVYPEPRPENAEANPWLNSKVVCGLIIFTPVAFTFQTWSYYLRILAWFILCLIIGLMVTQ